MGLGKSSRIGGGRVCGKSRGGADGQRLEEEVSGRAPRSQREDLWAQVSLLGAGEALL